nr:hypothetical protein BKA65DRAFT_558860 [Rhexocercosporidium sp. MPI-PUGE-AT-0058]
MSEAISEPVSPVTPSEDGSLLSVPRLSLDIEVQRTKEGSVINGTETGSFFSNFETSTVVESIRDTLKITASTARSPGPAYDQILPRTFQEQLGTWNMVVMTIGSLYALIILGFLWFLWYANERIPFWRWLVLKGYVQRTVTLSSAVLRTVVALQSSLSTSMLAALILETLGFRLRKSAFLSIQRSNGGLPFELLEPRYFWRHSKTILCLIVSLCTTTILAYFISTALISDFQLVYTAGYPVNARFSYTLLNKTLLGDEPSYTSYRPANFPVFAEYSEPVQKSDDQHNVDDTGPTVRALLPIPNPSTREQLHSFHGYGTLLNSHVVCVQPIIRNLTFESRPHGESYRFKPLISGEIAIGDLPPGIMFDPSAVDFLGQIPTFNGTGSKAEDSQRGPDNFVTFLCQMTPTSQTEQDESPISMCVAGNRLNYESAYLDPGRLPILGTRSTSLLNESIMLDPLSYVLVNYSGVPPMSTRINSTITIREQEWNKTVEPSSVWTSFIAPPTYPTLQTVSLTYCFPNFAAIDMDISVNGSAPRTEPALSKSNGSSVLYTSDVLRQLGADGVRRTPNARGILTLEKSTGWKQATRLETSLEKYYSPGSSTTALDGSYGFGMESNHFTPPFYRQLGMQEYISDYQTTNSSSVSGTWGLCTKCMTGMTDGDTYGVHPALSSIFQASLKRSGSVATAIQALFTVVNMMQYYDRISQFDYEDYNPLISQFEAVIVPRGRLGIMAVTVGLLLHISTVLSITVIFHLRTKVSFVGQSWHTVAQMQNEVVAPVLDRAILSRDSEVNKWLESEGIDGNERFFIGQQLDGKKEDAAASEGSGGGTVRRRH